MQNPVLASTPLITNDAVVLGLLALILGFVFFTSNSKNTLCKRFYKYVPALYISINSPKEV